MKRLFFLIPFVTYQPVSNAMLWIRGLFYTILVPGINNINRNQGDGCKYLIVLSLSTIDS